MFAHDKEEDKIYPLTLTELTEIADVQRKDQELKVYCKKNTKNPQKDIGLHLIEDTKVPCKNGKNKHSNISKAQGSKLVPPLPPTPWALPSRRDNEIHDVLERDEYYHPRIHQNLPILPSQ